METVIRYKEIIWSLPSYLLGRVVFSIEKKLYWLLATEEKTIDWINLLLIGNNHNSLCIKKIMDFVSNLPLSYFWWSYKRMIIQTHVSWSIEVWYQRRLHIIIDVKKNECCLRNIELNKTKQWIGKVFFEKLVQFCQDLSIWMIKLYAARDRGCNGYYTWAVFGVNINEDATIPYHDEFLKIVQSSSDPSIASVKTLLELISLGDRGKTFWRKHWFWYEGKFPCSYETYSIQQ